ncbi:MAG: STAS domain-containing protein [Cellvibrionales bacterium]|nr:STAS domain-containing protein [Cellvibrionales bacterium]
MGVSAKLSDAGDELTLFIEGRFDFSLHQAFRDAYQGFESIPETFTLDMSDATYLDSSALGMLLILRDYAGGDQAAIQIVNCNEDVKKILTISNFGQLFDIH